jgi:N,N'-diacetyllegionaminate synthase
MTRASTTLWPADRTYIIAEVGPNHDGYVERALEIIPKVAASGADAVKFQTYVSASSVVAKDAPLAEYMKRDQSLDGQEELLEQIRLSFDDFRTISLACKQHNITFLSTPFDVPSVDFLVELGVPLLKIPSGEITNYFLLQAAAKSRLPLIISTGMATIDEISAALALINVVWDGLETNDKPRPEIAILHCTSAYPAPFTAINLRALDTLEKTFNLPIGYSDHTLGRSISLAAVAKGACIIEKHVTPDVTLPGPDHAASLPLDELEHMVKDIRDINAALGDASKMPTPAEADVKLVARRAIVAAEEISAGSTFTLNRLSALRPETGISPMAASRLEGKVSRRSYTIGEFIHPDELD